MHLKEDEITNLEKCNIRINESEAESIFAPFNQLTIVLVFLLSVHDVRATDGVADEGEESHGEAEKDGSEGWVALPHGQQVGLGLVIRAVQSKEARVNSR